MITQNKSASELAEKILTYKRAYYAGTPLISDAEFDRLEEELARIDPRHPVLAEIGAEPPTVAKKVEHDVPMLSLQKTYDREELIRWIDGKPTVGMVKLDGNSLSLVYELGRLNVAKTRGNGRVGEDVTDKGHWVGDILPTINAQGMRGERLEIRGELCCSQARFLELAKEMEDLKLERPTNPRNIVAGILGRKDHVELARYFSFFAFDVIDASGTPEQFKSEIDKFRWLEGQGFKTPVHQHLPDADAALRFCDRVLEIIEEGDFGADGAVFVYEDVKSHETLGNTSHHPRYKMSFKWQGETAVSVIERIEWATSRRGVVTPVAIISPVQLSGAKITNVTLHNAATVTGFRLKSGDQIEVIRSGEVIPKFLRVIQEGAGNPELPHACPSCAGELHFDGVRLKCLNELTCPDQQRGAILNWIRNAEIDGLSDKRLTHMIESGMVRKIPDLYALSEEDLLRLPLTKEKMARNLYAAISASKRLPLARFLNGLGIDGMGEVSWEVLTEYYPTLDAIQRLDIETITAIDGFAEKTAQMIVDGLAQRRELIAALLASGVIPESHTNQKRDGVGVLDGKVLVITGALSRPRKDIERDIKSAGGRVSGSVSAQTFALVTNDSDTNSSKSKKARELGVLVITEDELMKMIAPPEV
jgi:DNA ligase (NAD+)